jgi:hypothetical protein
MPKPGHCHLPLQLASANRSHCVPNPALATSLIVFAVACGAAPACAADDPPSRKTEEQIAAQLANPLAPITTFVTQFRSEFGNGPDDTTNYQLRLQPSFFQPLEGGSALLVRSIVPLRKQNWPSGDGGLGDINVLPYYVPDIRSSTFVGYGMALSMPTATESSLGTGKWSAGPAVLFAQTGQPITWGGLAQQLWSFGGQSSRANVNVTTLQPFLTYLLGGGWSATVTSESSYDWNGAAGQRWLVPVTLGTSKVVDIGGSFLNVGVAYVHYVERPQFAPQSELRFSATYVFK